jgi:hypothetical protein
VKKKPKASKYNPSPVNRGTIFTTVACLERGEKIADIEKDFQRRPGQLKEMIEKYKSNGTYDKIVRLINRKPELPRCGVSYVSPYGIMHQAELIRHDC